MPPISMRPGAWSEPRTKETWAPSSGDSHYDSQEAKPKAAGLDNARLRALVCVCVCVCNKSFYPSQNMLWLMVTAIIMNH